MDKKLIIIDIIPYIVLLSLMAFLSRYFFAPLYKLKGTPAFQQISIFAIIKLIVCFIILTSIRKLINKIAKKKLKQDK